MSSTLHCSKAAVRRLLLKRSFLTTTAQSLRPTHKQPTPADVLDVIRALECVQIDPVAAVERNQHLVLGARINGYQPQLLNQLLETSQVFEYVANAACVLPVEDYPAVQGIRRRYEERLRSEIDKYQDVADAVLARLERAGPLPASAFDSAHKVHGYWDNQTAKTKATSHVLNLLNDVGAIRVVKRDGNTRYFDHAERSLPASIWAEAMAISTPAAERRLLEKYMRAYRVFDLADSRFGWAHWKAAERRAALQPYLQSGQVIPLGVVGCRSQYYALAEDGDELCALDAAVQSGSEPAWDADERSETARDGEAQDGELRGSASGTSKVRPQSVTTPARDIRFLPPLDNLLWRRSRIVDLFSFDYKWEIYTPAVKRTYGYYAMPILAGDRLIGRADVRLDRKQSTLVVENLQLEPTVRRTKLLQKALGRALERFARFHGATAADP